MPAKDAYKYVLKNAGAPYQAVTSLMKELLKKLKPANLIT